MPIVCYPVCYVMLCCELINCDLYTSYTTDQSKRRKIDGNRSNRKRVLCLRCDKILSADNTKYHQRSRHPGLAPSFRDICGRGQTLLNFKVDGRDIQVNEIVMQIF